MLKCRDSLHYQLCEIIVNNVYIINFVKQPCEIIVFFNFISHVNKMGLILMKPLNLI